MSELNVPVCWRLIASARFGRVVFMRDGDPWALPVNCAVIDHQIVFRTAAGSMLHDLRDGAVVQFEVDSAERVAESGWSVLVRGRAVEIRDERELARAAESGLHPWAPGERDQWMKIVPNRVSGRVISRGFHADDERQLPYMLPD
jgi:nitroimidazol reductase NimA-like FMN-containing flavoprotein (pyridoxamine 5'-phosphate oxidase superfamily)